MHRKQQRGDVWKSFSDTLDQSRLVSLDYREHVFTNKINTEQAKGNESFFSSKKQLNMTDSFYNIPNTSQKIFHLLLQVIAEVKKRKIIILPLQTNKQSVQFPSYTYFRTQLLLLAISLCTGRKSVPVSTYLSRYSFEKQLRKQSLFSTMKCSKVLANHFYLFQNFILHTCTRLTPHFNSFLLRPNQIRN